MKRKILSIIMTLTMVTALFPIISVHAAMKTVTVSNAEELLAAIASDTKIILEPGKYEITSETRTESWGSYTVSRNLYISNINNLEIYGNGQAEIVLDNGYISVIKTYNSSNIVFDGLTVGHDVPQYGCEGEGYVFETSYSSNIQINNCDIYGCGVYGIYTRNCLNLTITNSIIRDCMAGIALVYNDIQFNRCSFLRNAYNFCLANTDSAFSVHRSNETISVICNDCNFTDNSNTTFASDNINVITNNCDFVNNEWDKEAPLLKAKVTYNIHWDWTEPKISFEIVPTNPDDFYAIFDKRLNLQLYLAEYDDYGRLINVSTDVFSGSYSGYSWPCIKLKQKIINI